ncbi:hypothetical protein CY34DRAFT_809560 [Suillus luteus UH-Slu-Lm8-n1]|uniref:Unplaced genomic scaffold CY34scaffold_272, whole genome shotgun sequence n=1 Tax=Suillus luteus UH-Slu-Lm8-n1 TaxID=930992 RepID=A0A0D0B2T3_9AGAM|nr:hypothetical protein CY34DRAFT_809560 [Suillus luteus UH-Slu-Lm8-n1]
MTIWSRVRRPRKVINIHRQHRLHIHVLNLDVVETGAHLCPPAASSIAEFSPLNVINAPVFAGRSFTAIN